MTATRRAWLSVPFAAVVLVLTACGGPVPQPGKPAQVLLFSGHGTSPGDVAAFEDILRRQGLSYAKADSRRLNRMSAADLAAYRLLIVPGGNFVKIGEGLTPGAVASIRAAVRGGLNYYGACGGAFFAGASPYNGLNLAGGTQFHFYGIEAPDMHKAAVAISAAGEPVRDHYWEDGPQLSGWGDVVARYPDGTPAVAQGAAGKGWIVLTGTHPEAPESWRGGMRFSTPAREDQDYAGRLIVAALNGQRLGRY